jgi:hypothetical protein
MSMMSPESQTKEKNIDAILFSVNPKKVNVHDAINHLSNPNHKKLCWSVAFRIKYDQFCYPISSYIHICGEQVKYKAKIEEIIPYSRTHFDQELKPPQWFTKDNMNHPWKYSLMITHIKPFSYKTRELKKYKNGYVKNAPQGYIRLEKERNF